MKEGLIVKGSVITIKENFVIIRLSYSTIAGIAFKENCADTPSPDLGKLYAVGDTVKARVLEFDKSKRQLKLSLKPSDIPEDEDNQVIEVMESDEEIPRALQQESESDEEEVMESEGEKENESGDESAPVGGFGWDELGAPPEDSVVVDNPVEKSKKPKKLSEQDVALLEHSLAAQDSTPASEAEFERLMVANPSSSHLWLQYASWLLSLTEVAKARAVLRRGLKTIPVHLEEERSNLWLALMNLEAEYGDEDSLETLYKEVRQKMDDKAAALHLAGIYETKKQYSNAYNVWKQLAKDYKDDVSVWNGWCSFYFKQGDSDKSGEILKRALASLPKNEKTHMLTSYAILLYKYDKFDQGRTIFEDLVSKLPKRLDLWNVYVDQETKVNHFDFVRSLFKRMVEVKVSVNKIKGIFKKWLAFEDTHGDENSVKEVEEKVQEYISRLSS